MNGTSVPETIVDLCKKKVVTMFVDGDRGGNLIIKELTSRADVDFVTRAPDGKEVEEITLKEIHKALRSRISGEQAKLESPKDLELERRPHFSRPAARPPIRSVPFNRKTFLSPEHKQKFKEILENLVGTRGAQVLDQKLNTLGKVPISELATTIKSLNNTAYAVVFDGVVDRDIARAAESANVKYLIGMDTKVKPNECRVSILTVSGL